MSNAAVNTGMVFMNKLSGQVEAHQKKQTKAGSEGHLFNHHGKGNETLFSLINTPLTFEGSFVIG